MKNSILTLAVFASAFATAQKVNLAVEINNFKNNTGVVKVGLYNSEGTFLGQTFKKLESKIVNQKALVTFEGLEKGEYAISIYQDENLNGVMDRNFFGIPSEDYMASNNEKGSFGPPKYEKAKFIVKDNSKVVININ
jgi:uncharacterized protein (DUF2141 family)